MINDLATNFHSSGGSCMLFSHPVVEGFHSLSVLALSRPESLSQAQPPADSPR